MTMMIDDENKRSVSTIDILVSDRYVISVINNICCDQLVFTVYLRYVCGLHCVGYGIEPGS